MRTRIVLGLAAVCAPLALLVVVACSTTASAVGQGGECFQATDCQDGLACVPQMNGQSVCSNDLTPIQHTETMPDGAMPMMMVDGTAPMNDAPPGTDSPPPPPVDGNMPDNAQPPVDANMPDNAQPPVDANMPPVDSAGTG